MSYDEILAEVLQESGPYTRYGEPASYIPQLKYADTNHLGICVADRSGKVVYAGDAQVKFTIQSISKVFIFSCALEDSGLDKVMKKVSLEPTGDSFNSITSLETKNFNKPLNPMINAGAIASLTQVAGDSADEKTNRVLAFCRKLSGNPDLGIDEQVYQSEKETGARNRAMAYFMKSTHIIEGDVEELLDAYFRICAIEMDCVDLAKMALVYAMDGVEPVSGEHLLPEKIARIAKAVMAMCGMYDEAGKVAAQVGLPCKSGVGGGIMAAVPREMGIGVFSPGLNKKGSSLAGLQALTLLSQTMGLSIY